MITAAYILGGIIGLALLLRFLWWLVKPLYHLTLWLTKKK